MFGPVTGVFILGVYVGLGIAIGIAYYVADMPWRDDETRIERGIQAFVFGWFWLPFIVVAIGPLIARDVWKYLYGTTGDTTHRDF